MGGLDLPLKDKFRGLSSLFKNKELGLLMSSAVEFYKNEMLDPKNVLGLIADCLQISSALKGAFGNFLKKKDVKAAQIATIKKIVEDKDLAREKIEKTEDLIAGLKEKGVSDAEELFRKEFIRELMRYPRAIGFGELAEYLHVEFNELIKILKGDILMCSPAADVLKLNEDSPEYFRKTGPLKVDFVKGFVAERKEVKKIIGAFESKRVQIVVGDKASGKTVLVRNIACNLWDGGANVYFIDASKIEDDFARFVDDAKKIADDGKKRGGFLIIEDVHHNAKRVNDALGAFIKFKLKVLMTARPSYANYPHDALGVDDFSGCERYDLKAVSAVDGIIDNYAGKTGKLATEEDKERVKEYARDNLWVLSYALGAWDEETKTINESRVRDEVRKDMGRIEDKYGAEAPKILIKISSLSKYEIKSSKLLLEAYARENYLDCFRFSTIADKLSTGGELIKEVDQDGEEIEKYYSIPHSVLAELYLKYCREKSLTDATGGEEDKEVAAIKNYLALPVGNWAEVIRRLSWKRNI